MRISPDPHVVDTWRVVNAARDPHASLVDLTKLVSVIEPLADRVRGAASLAVRRDVRSTLDAVVLLGGDAVAVHARMLLDEWTRPGPLTAARPGLGAPGHRRSRAAV